MNWQTIFNPFSKLSEKTLLAIGILASILLIIACYFTDTKMDSLLHFSPAKDLSFNSIALYTIISLIYAIVLLFILGKIFNSKTRIIDIVNAVLVSQVPVIVIVLGTKLIKLDKISKQIAETSAQNKVLDINTFDLMYLMVFSFGSLIFIIYSFVLLFNGFKTATNIKKWQHIVIFAFVLLVGILICQIFLPQFKL